MKYNVRDEDGTEYKIEEIENVSAPLEEDNSDNDLSRDEIEALKKIASVADILIKLASSNVTDNDTEEEELEEEIDVNDEEEEEEEFEAKEKLINTEKCKSNDSIKKSAVAIEKKVKTVDSDEDTIAIAWANRYGGQK